MIPPKKYLNQIISESLPAEVNDYITISSSIADIDLSKPSRIGHEDYDVISIEENSIVRLKNFELASKDEHGNFYVSMHDRLNFNLDMAKYEFRYFTTDNLSVGTQDLYITAVEKNNHNRIGAIVILKDLTPGHTPNIHFNKDGKDELLLPSGRMQTPKWDKNFVEIESFVKGVNKIIESIGDPSKTDSAKLKILKGGISSDEITEQSDHYKLPTKKKPHGRV